MLHTCVLLTHAHGTRAHRAYISLLYMSTLMLSYLHSWLYTRILHLWRSRHSLLSMLFSPSPFSIRSNKTCFEFKFFLLLLKVFCFYCCCGARGQIQQQWASNPVLQIWKTYVFPIESHPPTFIFINILFISCLPIKNILYEFDMGGKWRLSNYGLSI